MPATARAKILNVDDALANRYATTRMLMAAGFAVVEAGTGEEALRLAQQGPDLILLDIHLPDMLGFDVCTKLRADPATSSIPVVHLTATVRRPDAKVKALELGADAYLTEPVEPEELVATINALLRARRAEQALKTLNQELERRVAERTALAESRAEEMRRLATALTLAEQKERKRIARQVHDNLAQLLILSKMRLSAMTRAGDGGDTPREVCGILDEAIGYTRTLISELSPPVLYDEGIVGGMQWLAERMGNHGLVVKVDDDGQPKALREEVLLTAFEGVRELLFNVIKHAKVGAATVRMRVRGQALQIEVIDGGTGFDTSVRRAANGNGGGFGLVSVRERLTVLGGKLEITSTLGDGTTATLRVPLISS
jgi:signal transduction histidine kinase